MNHHLSKWGYALAGLVSGACCGAFISYLSFGLIFKEVDDLFKVMSIPVISGLFFALWGFIDGENMVDKLHDLWKALSRWIR